MQYLVSLNAKLFFFLFFSSAFSRLFWYMFVRTFVTAAILSLQTKLLLGSLDVRHMGGSCKGLVPGGFNTGPKVRLQNIFEIEHTLCCNYQ